jgi:hypothetical protein
VPFGKYCRSAFVKDVRAYLAEGSAIKRDAIAARQLHALKEHQGPREKALRLSDVKAMFRQMRDPRVTTSG